jgi:hypothetical protein
VIIKQEDGWEATLAKAVLEEQGTAQWDALPLKWDGFVMPGRAPDHVAGSRGVDVRVGALERL